jgi:hypothetical protein
MTEVVVIEDEDNDSSPSEDAAPETSNETVDEIVEDVVHELSDVVEDVAEEAAESAAVEAVEEAVQEVVSEAAAVTTEAQFTELFRRLDDMQSQIIALQTPSEPAVQEAIVVVDDDAPVELDEDGVTDAIVQDVEEGVPGTEDGPDNPPGKYSDEPDERPNRKLGWKAFILGGSGGTAGRRR